MPIGSDDILSGIAARRHRFGVQQIGNSVDASNLVGVAALGAGTGMFLGPPITADKGRIARIAAGHLTTALAGDSTHDLIVKRFNPNNGLARGARTLIPLMAAPGIRLTSALIAGKLSDYAIPAEDEVTVLLQAPGGANQVKLPAADTRPDGWYCDADIYIIDGLGKGQKNRLTDFGTADKIAKVLNAEGSENWKVATDATSVARIRTRHNVYSKDNSFVYVWDFTVGTGAAGVDALALVEVESDESVDA